ncbi:L-histidine N(alpha)-methyltransferase [Actinocatenispora thailandica]|uniref:L-histidine N(alpha)-methyltransferase n=1 Tax=Actinocatenispora thailandica TaxID=227318 RepID=UPI00195292A1
MSERPTFDVRLGAEERTRALRADAVAGLTASPKWLRPTWFYDAHGSMLFDELTRLPGYYLTRAEAAVLAGHAAEVVAATDVHTLIELGSGASTKTRLIIEAGHEHGTLRRFVGFDVSESALASAAATLSARYPWLAVHAVVGDFTRHLDALPADRNRLVLFLGGTIGNLLPPDRAQLLCGLRAVLAAGDALLLGVGLVTDPDTMVRAYRDPDGRTAEFNRNVLRVLNRALGADFPVEAFDHVVRWDAEHEWVQLLLRATRAITVTLGAVDLTIPFASGELLCTAVSTRFHRAGITAELAAAGFTVEQWWPDDTDRFAVTLARAR